MTTVTHGAQTGTPFDRNQLRTMLRDVRNGMVRFAHSGMAMTGVLVVAAALILSARSDWRNGAERQLLSWLSARQTSVNVAEEDAALPMEPDAAERATAVLPAKLPKPQANVAYWLSRKYRVAPEPLGVLVSEAFDIGAKVRIDPTLILAVMAIESRFNPFAQSPVGAQGLMQVLTRVHTDKYDNFGGQLAAFDPVSNLRVGAQVLRDCIKRAGSTEGGLRLYVGAVTTDGSASVNKVTAEHLRIQSVALGKPMPSVFPVYRPAPETPVAVIAPLAVDNAVVPAPLVDSEAVITPPSDHPVAATPVRS